MTRLSTRLSTLLTASVFACSLCAAPAFADEDKVSLVVLEDGQTLEGRVTFQGDEVVIELGEGDKLARIRMPASAVTKIDPRTKSQVTEKARVTLHDGRVLHGTALEQGPVVRVRGEHGEVVLNKEEVASIKPATPEAPRRLIDAELGLQVPVPAPWEIESPVALGERLRFAHPSGRAFVSIFVRALPGSSAGTEQVRRALAADLSQQGSLREKDGVYRIRDSRRAYESEDLRLRVRGWAAPLPGGVLLAVLGICDEVGGGEEVVKETDLFVKRVRRLKGDRLKPDLFLSNDLRLLIEGTQGLRVSKSSDPKAVCELRTVGGGKGKEGTLTAFVDDDPDARAAMLDRLEVEPEVSQGTLGKVKVWRAKAKNLRAVAYRLGERTVVLRATATDVDVLADMLRSVRLLDPAALLAQADEARELGTRRDELATALADGKAEAASRSAITLLRELPEDPETLGLAIACARARKRPVLDLLDDLWTATGAAWVTEELGDALLKRAREARDAKEQRYVEAAESFDRALLVRDDEKLREEIVAFFTTSAEASFRADKRSQAWARMARARAAAENVQAVDDKERDLRLESAKAYLTDNKPSLARREAKRAWDLGASDDVVERLYTRAEAVERQLESAKRRNKKRGGGFQFGFPPNRRSTGRGRLVRPTAFTQNQGRSSRFRRRAPRSTRRRFRRANNSRAGRRVRPVTYGRSRRVNTNGRIVFGN